MGKAISLQCAACGKETIKLLKEYNRQIRKNPNRKFFCSLSCSCLYTHKQHPEVITKLTAFAKSGKKRSKRVIFCPFKYFLNVTRRRFKNKGRAYNLTLVYLQELWENQAGKCILTGMDLVLPDSWNGWNTIDNKIYRASLDRIDNSKGYIQGNVRFVSYAANIGKQGMSDNEYISFCKIIAKKHNTS